MAAFCPCCSSLLVVDNINDRLGCQSCPYHFVYQSKHWQKSRFDGLDSDDDIDEKCGAADQGPGAGPGIASSSGSSSSTAAAANSNKGPKPLSANSKQRRQKLLGLDVLGGEKMWEGVETTQAQCPSCLHNRAYVKMFQTRSADEPETAFYKCSKCHHQWKEDG